MDIAIKNYSPIEIRLGAVTALDSQLEKYGLTKPEIKVFVDDNSALNRAYIRDYLTESQVKGARAKLAKKIIRFIMQIRRERGDET